MRSGPEGFDLKSGGNPWVLGPSWGKGGEPGGLSEDFKTMRSGPESVDLKSVENPGTKLGKGWRARSLSGGF